jgi:glycosyltransferase involved in cell wall biosynthesis
VKLHTVFITYNRLELTKRALASYLETVTVPHTYIVVDNGSSDGTQKWLRGRHQSILLGINHYPGPACNRGWSFAPGDATHLHRADNDFIFLPGWCRQVEKMFGKVELLGQLGLRTDQEEAYAKTNVGGNCIIPMQLWNEGLRWDERPWPQIRDEVGPGWTEDSLMSGQVKNYGWKWDRVERPCIRPISSESPDDPYYKQTWADRGITEEWGR